MNVKTGLLIVRLFFKRYGFRNPFQHDRLSGETVPIKRATNSSSNSTSLGLDAALVTNEMGKLIREMDWSGTPLGPAEKWPQSLKTSVSMMLENPFPMSICWGKELIQLYNDGYQPILGSFKHPSAMGASVRSNFSEIWETIGPLFEQVMKGTAVRFDDFPLKMERSGRLIETYFTFSYSPLRDESGGIAGVLITCTETTERVLGERRLAEEREKLRSFFMQAPAAIAMLRGPELVFELANEPYERLVGRSEAQLVGRSVFDVFQELGPEIRVILDGVIHQGKRFVANEFSVSLDWDGSGKVSNRFVNFIYEPYRDENGTVAGMMALAFDVTDQVMARKEVERLASELQAAVASRDDFMSIASHELKTPITSLKLQLQMAKRRFRPESNAFEASLKQTERLTTLIEDLLDVSRIQAGKIEYVFSEVRLAELVQEVVEQYSEQLALAHCPLEVLVGADIQGEWDRSRIEQVLVNLISNAIKYAPGRPIRIRATSDSAAATLEVQDSGPGIPKERRDRIFERFERATSSRNISGLGLGLYIVNQIVKGHHGSVRLESAEGRGARFVVRLPLHPGRLAA